MNQYIMLIILLNFLIAVISDTYERVSEVKEMFCYRQKAQLNQECYDLIKAFKKLPTYKIIVLSTAKIMDEQEENAI